MTKRMLIDATHKEEIRVAITDGNKLVEYDYESQSRKPLKGSIFLAKVTRVEPSLQAAFVSFGGNRHGFLPFSEIHPDYFRIPVADREALMAEQEALIQQHDEEEALVEDVASDSDSEEELKEELSSEAEDVVIADADADADDTITEEKPKSKPKSRKSSKVKVEEIKDEEKKTPEIEDGETVEAVVSEVKGEENVAVVAEKPAEEAAGDEVKESADGDTGIEVKDTDAKDSDAKDSESDENKNTRSRRGNYRGRGRGGKRSQYRNRNVEVVGGEEIDDNQRFRFNLRRKYKIQEVIKRGQIMLIQVNKEERGNKGAAVGSYLSLPGRYCVLMPNSPRAGGVSRKIANSKDRARAREIVKELDVPKGMSVIVRTAGVGRTKDEIKRDLDYLMRLWDNIRDLTLKSTAPALVYEEADLIKRSVRDLYTSDVEGIYVAGENGYNTAKDFMKMIIPSHAKKVKFYDGKKLPLFNRYQIESQINEIGQPEVRLKSGGYLVINPTEALVSVDVNSGKATKGRHIEETALKTNLEAAEELARQLKLRDLGGLVVVDFIDMENRGNNAKVERRMKEALSNDRARIQVGRISSFGLMELSRQRLSPSLTEAQFEQCNTCSGIGLIRTADAMSILVLRAIEEEGIRGRAAQIIVQVTNNVALYILNYKRKKMAQIEERYNLEVLIRIDDEIPASEYKVEVSKPAEKDSGNDDDAADEIPVMEDLKEEKPEDDSAADGRTRRRGRRGGRNRNSRPDNEATQDGNNIEEAQQTNDADGNIAKTIIDESDDINGNTSPKPKSKPQAKPKRATKPRSKVKSNPPKTDDKKLDEEPAPKTSDPANDDKAADKKPVAKTATKKVASKTKAKAPEKVEKLEAKSEVKAVDDTPTAASLHETVNQAPKQKKKGWWNRL